MPMASSAQIRQQMVEALELDLMAQEWSASTASCFLKSLHKQRQQ